MSIDVPSFDREAILAPFVQRRSVKLASIKPDPVDRSLIEIVLEAATWAPNHGMTEPWKFKVYTGESRHALGAAFAEAYRLDAEEKGNFQQATFETYGQRVMGPPVWISLGMSPALRPDGSLVMPEWEEMIAVGCAVQNLHLAAAQLGLVGKWTSNFTALHPCVADFVGLKAPERLLGFFFLGWPDAAWPIGKRKPLSEKVTWAEDE